ncbi:MAG: Actin-like protein ATPase involved in cell division-like protein [Candidatus Saccharibacteria bacterium]|nr:Actin-like protein ATPase involved in cell division-like protein [Candidatus Saccharibacteria bacterium]
MLDKIKNLGQVAAAKTKYRKKNGEHYLVALDIGTENVKALIGRIVEDGIEIVGAGRAHQELSDMQAGAIADIAAVVGNCDKALAAAEQQAGISARTAVIGIAGELVKGTTTTVRAQRKDPEKALDTDEVERIVNAVQQRAQARAKQELIWELGGKEVDVRLVNSAVVNMNIDGYTVSNPIGFQGKEVQIELYTAYAPLIHIGALERTAKELDLDLLAVAAEPFAVARSVIGNDPNASMSAILMDVGGGTTDIAVINDGGVQGTKMFGIGGRAFTKSVERDLGVEFTQAEEFKLGLSDNHTPRAKVPAVEAALKKTLDVWTSGVELALAEFTKLDHLPHQLLLCGGGSSLDMLMEKLEESKWYASLPFTKRPVVKHIQPKQVVGIIDKSGQVADHTFITAMGLLRVGLDTLMQDSQTAATGTIKERLNRILKV